MGRKKYNKFDVSGEFGIGWSSNTNEEFYFDLEDYEKIKDICWHVHYTHQRYKKLEGVDITSGKVVNFLSVIGCKNYDHKDRNTLNNRKENLRICTRSQNSRNQSLPSNNTSGVIGVCWHKHKEQWQVRIHDQENHRKTIGYFNNKDDAVKARLQAELEYYGEFAPQQHLYEQYGIVDTNEIIGDEFYGKNKQ